MSTEYHRFIHGLPFTLLTYIMPRMEYIVQILQPKLRPSVHSWASPLDSRASAKAERSPGLALLLGGEEFFVWLFFHALADQVHTSVPVHYVPADIYHLI